MKNFLCPLLLIPLIHCAQPISIEGEKSTLDKARDSVEIWVHRVNSVGKLNEVEAMFSGVELDIMWVDGKLDVNHPPKESIGLSLTEYLTACNNAKNLGFWLDFKYLKKSFADSAVIKLNSICDQLDLDKSRFIVESNNTNALTSFSSQGYRTSYYVPSQMHIQDSVKVHEKLKVIAKNASVDTTMYLSSNYKDYPILKSHFPNREFLFWHTGNKGGMTREQLDEIVSNILNDRKVKVMLETYKSEHDR